MYMECIRVTEENEKQTVAELFAQAGNREKACIVLMKGGPEKVVVKTMDCSGENDSGCYTIITKEDGECCEKKK